MSDSPTERMPEPCPKCRDTACRCRPSWRKRFNVLCGFFIYFIVMTVAAWEGKPEEQ